MRKIARAARRRLHFPVALLIAGSCSLTHAALPDISCTPVTLSFKYQGGAALPPSQTLQVKSTGAALSFSVSISGPLPYSAQWLTVSANSGTTAASLRVYVNPTGLPSGSYSGNIVIHAPAAATVAQNVPVTLDVGDPPASLTASTASLAFTHVTGGAFPATQPVVLMTTGGALTASISITGAWLKASPSGSIALIGLPATVTVTADPNGLAPGSYTGKITFTSSTAANKTVSVNVTLSVTAGVPVINSHGIWPPGVLVNSPATVVTISGANYFSTSTAAIGTAPLTTTVLSPTTLLATIPAALLTTAGNLAITVATPSAASASPPATFVIYSPGPQVWAVVDSASYDSTSISPGEIITIYGTGLGPDDLATLPGTSPLPVSLPASGPATSVIIDGTAAPLLYTSANQVSCITPYAVAAKSGAKVNLMVSYNSVVSSAFQVDVADANPGVFTVEASGIGQGAILNYNSATSDYSVNGPSNAAAKGSIVVVYLTGFGQTNPAGDETQLISGTVAPVAQVGVTIGGQNATVLAAVAPVGSVPGLLQVNVTVPTNITAGNAVPVVVTVGAAHSQARVTMAVR